MNTGTDSGELQLHFLDYWRVVRVRLPLIILVFLLVVITASVITYLMPKRYESTVTMQVRQNDVTAFEVFNQTAGRSFDPRFLTTQFEIIQRKEILNPVITSLGLAQRWELGGSGEMTYEKLRRMIKVTEIRNTELIQITVLSEDKNESAEIANAIAEEYQRARIAEQQNLVTRSLTQLEDEVSRQEIKVEELREKAAVLRKENGIVDLNPDGVEESSMQAEGQDLLNVQQQVTAKRLEVATARAKYSQIAALSNDQVMRSLVTLEIQDPTIQQILPLFQEAASEEARLLNSGLGLNHPAVRSLKAKKDVMETQLREQIEILRITLAANLKIQEESLQNLEQSLEASRSTQQEAKTRSTTYYQAKNAYIQAKAVLQAAEARLSTQTIERGMPQSPTVIWERAVPAEVAARPRVWLNIALSVVVGLVFGVGLAFFIEYLDTSVKTMEDVESFLQVPVLAVIPKNISILLNEPPDNPDAEAYRIMRTNIEFNRKNPDANTITVVSGGTGEGKSTTMSNIAFTFAKGGYSTLIVDADLRRPSQHRIFGVGNDVGLTDCLTTDIDLEEAVIQTKVDNLYLLTSGKLPSDAAGILNSQRMVEFIEEVKSRFDIIFFDSPPILGVSDASVLSSAIDLTIIVVQHRRFPRAMLQRVKQAILNVGGNILGVVLNNVDVRHDQHYEYYTSYYNYYYQKPSAERTSKPAKPTPVAVKEKHRESGGGDSY